jgi:hypothetical protein
VAIRDSSGVITDSLLHRALYIRNNPIAGIGWNSFGGFNLFAFRLETRLQKMKLALIFPAVAAAHQMDGEADSLEARERALVRIRQHAGRRSAGLVDQREGLSHR